MTALAEAPLFAEVADGPPDGRAFWTKAEDGVRLRVGHWPGGTRGSVLLIPGRTEYIEKYGPTAANLVAEGWHVLALDVRGQGLADRPLPDPMVGHVRAHGDYQRDVAAAVAAMRSLGLPAPFHLLGHSMGGAIGLRAMIEGKPFQRAAFSAPMWGIRLSTGVEPAARVAAAAAKLVGRHTGYAPGTGKVTYLLAAPFAGNTLTTDEATWNWMRHQSQAHPELTLGGPSLAWAAGAMAETRWLARQVRPRVPTVVLLGSGERIVNTAAVQAMVRGWPEARLLILPGAEHEVLMEAPPIRKEAIAAIVAHLAG